jgi:ABC-type antimicrobial peptide transport system permease subunit
MPIGSFGGIALLLSGLGVYATLAGMVTSRAREFGVA